jgi:hypothetical protein
MQERAVQQGQRVYVLYTVSRNARHACAHLPKYSSLVSNCSGSLFRAHCAIDVWHGYTEAASDDPQGMHLLISHQS